MIFFHSLTHSHSALLLFISLGLSLSVCVCVWVCVVAHDDGISCVKWSPSGTRIVTGSLDSTVKIWSLPKDASTYNLEFKCVGHPLGVVSVDVNPEGSCKFFLFFILLLLPTNPLWLHQHTIDKNAPSHQWPPPVLLTVRSCCGICRMGTRFAPSMLDLLSAGQSPFRLMESTSHRAHTLGTSTSGQWTLVKKLLFLRPEGALPWPLPMYCSPLSTICQISCSSHLTIACLLVNSFFACFFWNVLLF